MYRLSFLQTSGQDRSSLVKRNDKLKAARPSSPYSRSELEFSNDFEPVVTPPHPTPNNVLPSPRFSFIQLENLTNGAKRRNPESVWLTSRIGVLLLLSGRFRRNFRHTIEIF